MKSPQIGIIVQVLPPVACLTIVDKYSERKGYNLNKIAQSFVVNSPQNSETNIEMQSKNEQNNETKKDETANVDNPKSKKQKIGFQLI